MCIRDRKRVTASRSTCKRRTSRILSLIHICMREEAEAIRAQAQADLDKAKQVSDESKSG